MIRLERASPRWCWLARCDTGLVDGNGPLSPTGKLPRQSDAARKFPLFPVLSGRWLAWRSRCHCFPLLSGGWPATGAVCWLCPLLVSLAGTCHCSPWCFEEAGWRGSLLAAISAGLPSRDEPCHSGQGLGVTGEVPRGGCEQTGWRSNLLAAISAGLPGRVEPCHGGQGPLSEREIAMAERLTVGLAWKFN